MNAKFLERLIAYRKTRGFDFAKTILSQKIKYQFAVAGERKASAIFVQKIASARTMPQILLIEASSARLYWKKFGQKIGAKATWFGRTARRRDPVNQLLDIGYHYLAQKVIALCQEINLPTELGIFHRAQSAKASPLAYDFMEIMRPVLVDDVLLKTVRKKKREVSAINQRFISSFVYRLKKKGDVRYFHRKLGYCIKLTYWMRLLLLEFMGCVHSSAMYHPLFPSLRHESRCEQKSRLRKDG